MPDQHDNMAAIEPIMRQPTQEEKEALEISLETALDAPLSHPPYQYLILPDPIPADIKRTMDRILICELAMYPSKFGPLRAVDNGTAGRRQMTDFRRILYTAYNTATALLDGTDVIIQEHAQEIADNERKKRADRKKLSHQKESRFRTTKQLVLDEVAREPMKMSPQSFIFLGVELAKYHAALERREATIQISRSSIRLDVMSQHAKREGYKSFEDYADTMRAWDIKLDNYYKFHKKTQDEVAERVYQVWLAKHRARRLKKDRTNAALLIPKERFLTEEAKKILLYATETDDEFVSRYMRITLMSTPQWSADHKTQRERDLIDVLCEYMDRQPNVKEDMEAAAKAAAEKAAFVARIAGKAAKAAKAASMAAVKAELKWPDPSSEDDAEEKSEGESDETEEEDEDDDEDIDGDSEDGSEDDSDEDVDDDDDDEDKSN